MQSTESTVAFPLEAVDTLIAELEATVTDDVPLGSSDTWPSELCTGRPTCIPR